MFSRARVAFICGTTIGLCMIGSVAAQNPTTSPAPTSSPHEVISKEGIDRIIKRKNELNLKLTQSQVSHLQARCRDAQVVSKGVSDRVGNIQTQRSEAYASVITKLNDLQLKMTSSNVDSPQLTTVISALQAHADNFKKDIVDYKNAISDLSIMDCVTDSVGFQATLITARATHDKVAADSTQITKDITDGVQPALDAALSQISSQNIHKDKK
ncbi:MAG: hypothetical protein NVSMB46_05120 [Candidatus Saccharimonadales bacterium]